MRKIFMSTLICSFIVPAAFADTNLVTKRSANSVAATMNCLESVLRAKGLTIFANIDHAQGARKVGMMLRPTRLLIFGNPKIGTQLMASRQTVGIDLPMKALVWQDAAGQVWLSYNAPQYIAGRHGVVDRAAAVAKMKGALAKFTEQATQPNAKGC